MNSGSPAGYYFVIVGIILISYSLNRMGRKMRENNEKNIDRNRK